nr:dynein axonemal assembly factor 9-like [Lytechinus pictus]
MVGEPLKSYYSHGKVSNSRNNEGQSGRKPYVLFGQNSMKAHMNVTQEGGILPGKTLHISGVGDTPAKHMICQLVAPRSPLCCAESYFHAQRPRLPHHHGGSCSGTTPPPKTDIE